MKPYIEQPSLFSVADVGGTYLTEPTTPLTMTPAALQAWKHRIFEFQQQVRRQPIEHQGSLFEGSSNKSVSGPCEPGQMDPFDLPQQNTNFWRWKAEDAGVSALYFVIDYALPLLLYVGETVKSNQRWKGEHDCKRYLLNYQQAHYQSNLPTTLGIAFWSDAPAATRQRQRLESALIYKWRSPFNKENWKFWGTPFVGE
jgi:hypothetical protein